jgi:hypothetical protein
MFGFLIWSEIKISLEEEFEARGEWWGWELTLIAGFARCLCALGVRLSRFSILDHSQLCHVLLLQSMYTLPKTVLFLDHFP